MRSLRREIDREQDYHMKQAQEVTVPATKESTETLTMELPVKFMAHIRARAAQEGFATVPEYIESLLVSETLFEPIDEDELVHWCNTEGVRRLEAMEAHPSSCLTIDQAFEGLIGEDQITGVEAA
jgi:hypothetical protein